MIKLGEWLERFLDPSIKVWEYKTLAIDAVKLLDIEYTVDKNDLTFKAIELIETSEDNPNVDPKLQEVCEYDDEFYKSHPKSYSKLLFSNVRERVIKDRNEKEIFDRTVKRIFSNEKLETHTKNYYKHYRDIDESEDLLTDIRNADDPLKLSLTIGNENAEKFKTPANPKFLELWEQIFPETIVAVYLFKKYIEANFTIIDHYKDIPWGHTQGVIDDLYIDRRCYIWLYAAYNDLSDQLTHTDDSFKILKKFHGDRTFFSTKIDGVDFTPVFPWDIVSSRIFFDFLFLGGQEYFMFCEYCGKFTVIKRKGRKKFCSDICRSNKRFKK